MRPRRRRPGTTRPVGSLGSLAGHFTREGTPKKRYRTEAEAKSAAQLAWTLNGAELSSYRCEQCHLWHIGGRSRRD